MTAKQKAAREKFKKVVAEAAKLRKKNPSLTHAQAVKQAFAISYSKAGQTKKVGAVKKKATPKKKAALKKASPKKKSAPKKVASKRITDIHKDSKSHNVNIRVVSGTDDLSKYIKTFDDIQKDRDKKEISLKRNIQLVKEYENELKKPLSKDFQKINKEILKNYKRSVISDKKSIKELNILLSKY